jgi:hypothetical protein
VKKGEDETVSAGTETIGRIVLRDRGYECFDPDGKYLFCDPTLAGARKALFQRHKDQREAASA